MKTILVDAINAYVNEDGSIYTEMHDLLQTFPNPKVVLTGANDEQFKHFGLEKVPYELFSLKHNPEKIDPEYFRILLNHLNLSANEVIYFEHSADAVKSAESVGIKTMFYDHEKRDLAQLKEFLQENL